MGLPPVDLKNGPSKFAEHLPNSVFIPLTAFRKPLDGSNQCTTLGPFIEGTPTEMCPVKRIKLMRGRRHKEALPNVIIRISDKNA